MSRVKVVWLEQALEELTANWLEISRRDEMTRAVAEIDRQLQDRPHLKGTELSEGLRKLVVPPLAVYYSIRDDENIVEVSSVKRSQ